MRLKNKLDELRKLNGITQEEFAKELRVSRQTISAIENGKYNPSLDLAFEIALYFNMTIEEVMKKSNLIYGLIYTILAGIFLYLAITFDNKISGIFYGMTGALGANGIFIIIRYFYWQKNKEKYQEKLESEEIEQNDELKQKLRDKAGKYTYWIGMLIIALSIMVYSVLGVLNIMDTEHIVIYLGAYLISQVFIGVIVFNHLLKKYD